MTAAAVLAGDFGPAPLEQVFAYVSAVDLLEAAALNRYWSSLVVSDSVWSAQCQQLWSDKVYVPERFKIEAGATKLRRIQAYWESLKDSRRIAVTPEELCQFQWSSRMKGWAGPDWTCSDPWWQEEAADGSPRRRTWIRKFHPDGTTSGDRGAGSWRFVPDSCGRTGPEGCFIRMGRGGREFPTHFASRWARNWGWILQNCWGFSTSFPLPLRGSCPDLEDQGEICRSVSVETCSQEANLFNLGLPLPHSVDAIGGHTGEGLDMVEAFIGDQRLRLPRALLLMLLRRQQEDGVGSEGEHGDENEEGEEEDGDVEAGDEEEYLDVMEDVPDPSQHQTTQGEEH